MKRKCYRCGAEDHLKRDCPPDLPDLSSAHAYWDTTAPLVPIEEAWWGREPESPARIARETRLRAEAARQVAESRDARRVL